MSVSVWVSKIPFKTGFSGLGLGVGFHPCLMVIAQANVNRFSSLAKQSVIECIKAGSDIKKNVVLPNKST